MAGSMKVALAVDDSLAGFAVVGSEELFVVVAPVPVLVLTTEPPADRKAAEPTAGPNRGNT